MQRLSQHQIRPDNVRLEDVLPTIPSSAAAVAAAFQAQGRARRHSQQQHRSLQTKHHVGGQLDSYSQPIAGQQPTRRGAGKERQAGRYVSGPVEPPQRWLELSCGEGQRRGRCLGSASPQQTMPTSQALRSSTLLTLPAQQHRSSISSSPWRSRGAVPLRPCNHPTIDTGAALQQAVVSAPPVSRVGYPNRQQARSLSGRGGRSATGTSTSARQPHISVLEQGCQHNQPRC